MKKFALAGNPNCGKTTLFNALTGSTAYVGNWPGVTVDKKEGSYKKLTENIAIIDLPGIYSLSPYTPEEIITRNYMLDEKPDCIINIVDATNLERNLYLTTQIMEMDIPVIIALNMMDVVRKRGYTIDIKGLEKRIGVPVVEISALKEENIDYLMKRAVAACATSRDGMTVLKDSSLFPLINDCVVAFKDNKISHPLFHAIKLVESDEVETTAHANLLPLVDAFKDTFTDNVFETDFEALIADARYKYITQHFSSFVNHPKSEDASPRKKRTLSDKIDRVLTNKWAGLPIFLAILFLVFHLTFSENLFYLGGLFSNIEPSFTNTAFEGLFWTSGGLNSPGVILFNLVDSITSLISGGVESLLSTSPAWVSGFLVDGVLGGLFAVIGFLPQILVLFLFFSILEDSGYMARVAFILDRIFRKFGLTGKAFMPMVMGFGCSLPAMINTRTLGDDDERTATIRVIPFFSCGAKLPILVAIAGGIVQYFKVGNADLITYSMYLLGIIVAITSIIIMRHTTMRGEASPFIMELPSYHAPQFKALMIHLWDKMKHFIKKAFTIILASTILIWFLSSFSWNYEFLLQEIEHDGEMVLVNLRMNESILGSLGQLIAPLFTPLGFGSQLKNFSWVFVVAAMTGLIAKENVIATFGVLAAAVASGYIDVTIDGGEVEAAVQMIQATGITIPALLSFIAFNMTTIPCFAAVATAKAELPKKKFGGTIVFWLLTSYIVSSMIYLIGSWWWTSFIFIALGVLAFIIIHCRNTRHDKIKLKEKTI